MTKRAKPPSRGSQPPKPKPEKSFRDPTPAEAEAIRQARETLASRPYRACVAVERAPDGSVLNIGQPHADGPGWSDHLTAALGTSSRAFSGQALARIANAVGDGAERVSQEQFNAALALMGAVNPQDELEAAIGEQIIAAHVASMDYLRRSRVNAGEYRDTAVAYANAATKLSRTMLSAIETLGKHRSGGKQTHEVRYVYVNGPAVFGDHAQTLVHAGGGGVSDTNYVQPHVPGLAFAPGAKVWGEDATGNGLPAAGNPRPEAMPASWRPEPGRADREGERPLSDGVAHPRAAGGPADGPRPRKARQGYAQ